MEEGKKYETSGLPSVVVPIDGSKGLLVATGLLWRWLLCWKDGRGVIKREEEVQRCRYVCGLFGTASSYLWTLVQAAGPFVRLVSLWYSWWAKGGVKAEPYCLTI